VECKALGTGGVAVCDHNIQRAYCRECGGSQICEHDRTRTYCKECKELGMAAMAFVNTTAGVLVADCAEKKRKKRREIKIK
jgi:hypothetical protein